MELVVSARDVARDISEERLKARPSNDLLY